MLDSQPKHGGAIFVSRTGSSISIDCTAGSGAVLVICVVVRRAIAPSV